MRLHEFIASNMEAILKEWEDFARTIQPPDGDMNVTDLRDHAEQMLLVIVGDMATEQSDATRKERSQGNGPDKNSQTAAETHADERLLSGFSLTMLVSEYRALRASVLSLWTRHGRPSEHGEMEDIIHFNEAMDQALAESIARYSAAINKNSDVFLGMLGHDLRSPLQFLSMGARKLKDTKDGNAQHVQLGTHMLDSVQRMTEMLDNLMDFTESRIGSGIRIDRRPADLAEIAGRIAREFRGSHPDHSIREVARGDCSGHWDVGRVGQICQNLIGNALEHGAASGEIVVTCDGRSSAVTLSVHNHGVPIPRSQHSRIFQLSARGHSQPANGGKHVGLGLYIVNELVAAHAGSVSVLSSEEGGTLFKVELPRGAA
ncbi:sensor histidine kinase [Halopseudomonas nanhaiensis]|uniref:sensor histidine kinase n=1 Tax=Halopseudomonas nanhaiensis TaxID=2830842 RepID=UPI001CBD1504|nr:sensor histidine kinase [Halopseudomonas nanhaiensis]UAW97227.1 sensor histidine kinase [Halopseudomonas nanhaiensis]